MYRLAFVTARELGCRWVALVIGLAVVATGCATRETQPAVNSRPTLPAQFDPPLPAPAPAVERRWWAPLDAPLLDQLVARALAANYDVRTAMVRIAQSRAVAALAAAEASPQVTAGGTAGRVRLDPQGGSSVADMLAPERLGGSELGLDASWELDVSGAIAHRQSAALAELEAAIAESAAVEVMVAGEIVATYVELRSAQAHTAALRELVEIARDSEALASARARAGLAAELDRVRATEQLATTRAEIPPALARADLAVRKLGVLVAGNSQALAGELATTRPLPEAAVPLPAAIPATLLDRRPDLVVAERRSRAALARLAGAEATRLPRLSLGVALGLASISAGTVATALTGRFGVAAMAASMRLPLHAPQLAAVADLERARADEAALAYERAAVAAVLEVEQALLRLTRSREREAHLRVARGAAADALRLARERYERGLTDFLAVLDAMRSHGVAQRLWIDAQTATLVHYVALCKALGGGWDGGGRAAELPR